MVEYFKFWIAEFLTDFAVAFSLLVLVVAGIVVAAVFVTIRDWFRSR